MQEEFRKFLDLYPSQSEAAKALGVDKSFVSRIVAGQRGISPDLALRIEQLSAGKIRKESLIWPQAS